MNYFIKLLFLSICVFLGQYALAESPQSRRSVLDEQQSYMNATILPLVEKRDFKQLEQYAQRFITEDTRFPSGNFRLEAFYEVISTGDHNANMNSGKAHEKLIADWRKYNPRSPIPSVVMAMWHKSYAWSARGSRTADKVSNEDMKTFKAFLGYAWDELLPWAKKKVQDPQVYTMLLDVALGLDRSLEELDSLYKQGATIIPGYYPLSIRMLMKIVPKWGGSQKQVVDFITQATDLTNVSDGNCLYFVLAHITTREEYDTQLLKALSAERIWQGFEETERRFPGYSLPLHRRALIARYLEDWPKARIAFQAIDGLWDKDAVEVWRSQAAFERNRLKTLLNSTTGGTAVDTTLPQIFPEKVDKKEK